MNREDVLQLLGDRPIQKGDSSGYLIVREEKRKDFLLKEVAYKACDGETIEALLLIPPFLDLSQGKHYPSIIALHQHGGRYDAGMLEPAGLCEHPANTFAVTLCKAGFIVLCPEQIGFGRRREQFPDGTLMTGRDNERWLFIDYYLKGRTLLGKCLFDLSCAVDMLQRLPFVDKERIGVCGHSMGGLLSYWFGWYEKRVKAIFSCCGFSSLTLLQASHLNHTFAMYLPGLLTIGDTPELLEQLAPTPLYLSFGATDDIFPLEGSKHICAYAKSTYDTQHAGERCLVEITDDSHTFTPKKQEKATHFFKVWL
ncbi:MAG: alpha/beta hydrolase family protein [Sphaerochaetaceae bacterium]